MKNFLIALLVVCSLVLSGGWLLTYQELNETRQELGATRETLSETKQGLLGLEGEVSGLEQEVLGLKGKVSGLEQEVLQLEEFLRLHRDTFGRVYSGIRPLYLIAPGVGIDLINNPEATNPAWAELRDFIALDTTDTYTYIYGIFMCGAFAEKVHNRAEAAGIRAAFVAVCFEGEVIGHALNAFKTTDKGLVFVDCTGGSPYCVDFSCWDRIAYLVIGKELGSIHLEVAHSPKYCFYIAYRARLEAYNKAVKARNQEVEAHTRALIEAGGPYLYEPEYSRFRKWYDRLERWRLELEAEWEELGDYHWEPMGIVSEVRIYW